MEIELEVVPVYVVFTPLKTYGGGGESDERIDFFFLIWLFIHT